MERQLKFRAWSEGQMIHCPIATTYGLHRFFGILADDAIVMQFTGLIINDVEVYEGDILMLRDSCGDPTNYVVEWHQESYQIVGHCKHDWLTLEEFQEAEIVGNIHESDFVI